LLHPATELRHVDAIIGYGVFATEPIPIGTITWVLDPLDQVIDAERARQLEARLGALFEKYTWLTAQGKRVLCWDFGKFMNHSCDATSLSPGMAFEVAVRDIEPGEQLTCDYGSLNLERAFDCRCGSRTCRGIVRPEDFEHCAPAWDARLQRAFPYLAQVRQPLWDWVQDMDRIEAGLASPGGVPSILVHRWPGSTATLQPTKPPR
jgi:hypothetical protein